MRHSLLLPLLCAAAVGAAEPSGSTPLLVQIGGDYLSGDLRRELATDWGYRGGLAVLLAESAVVGVPTLDLDVRYAPDGEGSLFSFEASYAERALLGDRMWAGLGLGSNFVRLKLDQTPERAARADRRWSLGGKAMVGYLITDRLFVEATWHYTREVLDLDSNTVSLGLGFWF